MSAISAADVKKLRDVTGAGMMDCKKAWKKPVAIWMQPLIT
jgi:translation elongation factor EF-Ts